MAYRMQTSVPGVMDLSAEKPETFDLYGPDSRKSRGRSPRTACSRAGSRRRGVKFIQLYHQGWDQHDNLPKNIQVQCRETDQPSAALITDLKQRGMLDDTLVDLGRRVRAHQLFAGQTHGGQLRARPSSALFFSTWLAGGGVKPGLVYGETDDFSYNVTKDGVHVHDFHATLLRLLGRGSRAVEFPSTRAAASGSPMFMEKS